MNSPTSLIPSLGASPATWSAEELARILGEMSGLDADLDSPMKQLLGSAITYRIAVGPQQGRKVFTLQTLPQYRAPPRTDLLICSEEPNCF